MRGKGNWIARALAVLSMVIGMISAAHADGLVLPERASHPVVMAISANASLANEPSELLKVYIGQPDGCCEERTPIAGRYEMADGKLSFLPAFGFDLGQDYVATVWNPNGTQRIPFRIGSEAAITPAVVTEVFPSDDVLPENILRFYIHFSVPMQPHVAFNYIKLRDASGKADEAAFMQFKQELWNEDRTRLTVLVDPGRIKRSVATNIDLGPALLAGRDYMLTVDAGWPSADGDSVLPNFEKRFTVTAPLRELPDVGLWRITAPCANTNDPFVIGFDRPFDRHLLTQDIRVNTKAGQEITGTITVGEGERSWSFVPNAHWPSGNIQIDVRPSLEDVAANNFHDLLDQVASAATKTGLMSLPVDLPDCAD